MLWECIRLLWDAIWLPWEVIWLTWGAPQPAWERRRGILHDALMEVRVAWGSQDEADSGPMGDPGPSWSPRDVSHLTTVGYRKWAFPYGPTFGQPPSHLAAAVREPKD